MGRTIPSYRIIQEEELKRWERFRGFLRIDDRMTFDDMMDECRRHASAAGAGAFPSKTEGMFLSILFAHHRNLKELHSKIEFISSLLAQSGTKAEGQTGNRKDG